MKKHLISIYFFVLVVFLSACSQKIVSADPLELSLKTQSEILETLESILCAEQRTSYDGFSPHELDQQLDLVKSKKISVAQLNPTDYFAGSYIREEDHLLVIQLQTEPCSQIEELYRTMTSHPEVLVFESRESIHDVEDPLELAELIKKYRSALKREYGVHVSDAVPFDSRYAVCIMIYDPKEDDLATIRKAIEEYTFQKWNIPIRCVAAELEVYG